MAHRRHLGERCGAGGCCDDELMDGQARMYTEKRARRWRGEESGLTSSCREEEEGEEQLVEVTACCLREVQFVMSELEEKIV
jgi:hypothetical protein